MSNDLLKTLSRAYLCLDQKWVDEKTPSACANFLMAKDSMLEAIKVEISKLQNEHRAKEVQDKALKIDKFELIQKGFKYLKQDCSGVSFVGIVNEIPKKAIREDYADRDFDYEFNDTKSDGFDEAAFWGFIYLPFIDGEYMKFDVHA